MGQRECSRGASRCQARRAGRVSGVRCNGWRRTGTAKLGLVSTVVALPAVLGRGNRGVSERRSAGWWDPDRAALRGGTGSRGCRSQLNAASGRQAGRARPKGRSGSFGVRALIGRLLSTWLLQLVHFPQRASRLVVSLPPEPIPLTVARSPSAKPEPKSKESTSDSLANGPDIAPFRASLFLVSRGLASCGRALATRGLVQTINWFRRWSEEISRTNLYMSTGAFLESSQVKDSCRARRRAYQWTLHWHSAGHCVGVMMNHANTEKRPSKGE